MGMFSTTPAEAATLTHLYQLNNTLADSRPGGPSLVSNEGTIGTGGYTFGSNQGPSLSNAINSSNYSILMDFSLNDVTGFKKLIDFKDRTLDSGLYNFGGALNFYDVTNNTKNAFANNTLARLVITRDTLNNFAGYVNGVQQISFKDVDGEAIFGQDNIIHFLRDDLATKGSESASGLLAKVAIYDDALSADEVKTLGGTTTSISISPTPDPTPVPTPALLPGLIGLGLGMLKKRKAETVVVATEA